MQTVYHVTSRPNAERILAEGFAGGWGDVGFGVYFYGDFQNALSYLDQGGWDGELDPDSAVIVAAEVDEADIDYVIVDPEWPNPEDYDDVVWHPMDDENDARWKPAMKMFEMENERKPEALAPGV